MATYTVYEMREKATQWQRITASPSEPAAINTAKRYKKRKPSSKYKVEDGKKNVVFMD